MIRLRKSQIEEVAHLVVPVDGLGERVELDREPLTATESELVDCVDQKLELAARVEADAKRRADELRASAVRIMTTLGLPDCPFGVDGKTRRVFVKLSQLPVAEEMPPAEPATAEDAGGFKPKKEGS